MVAGNVDFHMQKVGKVFEVLTLYIGVIGAYFKHNLNRGYVSTTCHGIHALYLYMKALNQ
ncbi:hypothetical protein CWB99_04300 [Pseudoalteromonas rubra]|uniref:Uncharacterized protein n=1 Tax=Pseudoalteromonas rubra TaxID=43658 RepID=A0A5S3WR80_9GAMM|nr:hypothetical protein CWB99_04300 [Pseudoalteromonas rubra]TMP34563.1 hypothetical protein CWC00_07205 [Pseudoalteromonas rubra]